MNMNLAHAGNEIRELNVDELDAASGGKGILDTVVQVVKEAVQIVTGNAGVCTNHWYSD